MTGRGVSGSKARRYWQSVKPSPSGSMTSSRASSGFACRYAASASCTFAAWTTWEKPSAASMAATMRRSSGSSSTRRILRFFKLWSLIVTPRGRRAFVAHAALPHALWRVGGAQGRAGLPCPRHCLACRFSGVRSLRPLKHEAPFVEHSTHRCQANVRLGKGWCKGALLRWKRHEMRAFRLAAVSAASGRARLCPPQR